MSFEFFAAALVDILLDSAIKGGVVLGLAAVALRCMHRRSAAARHLMLSLALGSLLFLPLLSWTLPHLAVLPAWMTLQAPAPAPAPAAAPGFASPAPMENARAGGPQIAGPAPQTRPQFPAAARARQWPLFHWALGLWLLGAGAVLLPTLAGAVSLRRLKKRACLVDSGPLPELFEELATTMNVRRRVLLFTAADRSMPMTWGVREPKILLPREAARWPLQRQRLVLLHELAHIARGDFSSTLLARLACALHWWNPLVWAAARRSLHEQEQACDDLVLHHGARPAAYAQELLGFAAGRGRLETLGGLAMARPSSLEGRLLAILDSTRNRTAPTRPAVLIAALLSALALVPISMLGAAQIAGPVPPAANAAAFERGLVGWWRADADASDSTGRHPGEVPFGVRYIPGLLGQAFDFRRSYAIAHQLQRVSVPDSPDFELSREMTLEAWIYPRGSGGIVLLRGDDRPGFDTCQIDLMTEGAVSFSFNSADNQAAGIQAPIALHQWQHVVATFLDGAMKLYVNGVLLSTGETPLRPVSLLEPLAHPALGIGNAGGTLYNMPFDGLIDEVRIYNRALDAAEIAQALKR